MQQAKCEEGAFTPMLCVIHPSAGTNFAVDRVVRMARDPFALELQAVVNVTLPVQVALPQGRSIGPPMVPPHQWNVPGANLQRQNRTKGHI